eukprot:jgi/Psemu1/237178/estExt_Genewise1.C_640045
MTPLQSDTTSLLHLPESSLLPPTANTDGVLFAEMAMNRALYDPPRWGWTALGGIADVLSPHEVRSLAAFVRSFVRSFLRSFRSRRHSTCMAYKKKAHKAKRSRKVGGANISNNNDDSNNNNNNNNTININDINNSNSNSNSNVSKYKDAAAAPISLLKDPPSCSTVEPSEVSSSSSSVTKQPKPKPTPTATATAMMELTTTTTTTTTTTATRQCLPSVEAATSESAGENLQEKPENTVATEKETETGTESESEPEPESTPTTTAAEGIGAAAATTAAAAITTTIATAQQQQQQQQQQIIDAGIQAVGIPTNILGISIELQSIPQRQNQQQQRQQQQQQRQQQQLQQPPTEGNGGGKIDRENKDATATATATVTTNNMNTRPKKKCGRPPKGSRRSGAGVVPKQKSKYDCHVRSLGTTVVAPQNTIATTEDDDDDDDDAPITISSSGTKNGGSGAGMVLDMYAYHQGREGMEARDADTGELLFTQRVTDTNHELDGPKSVLTIRIEFPLEDSDAEDSDDGNGNTLPRKKKATYQEDIPWDLLDANTPTPLAFATSIGKEFGLSFGETMDLAARMDKQIERHVAENTQFREPIALVDNGNESTQKRKIGPIIQPYRYDRAVRTEREGGTFKPKKDSRILKPRPSVSGNGGCRQNRNGGNSITTGSSSSTSKLGRRRDSNQASNVGDTDRAKATLDEELVPELLNEVKRRSDREAKMDVSQKCKGGKIGYLEVLRNAICHICKKRTDVGLRFQCSMKNHVYCEFHVKKRLRVTGESGSFVYKSCPICSLTCECAKCVRKLNNVATVFKARCIEEKKQLSQLVFPDILSICRNAIPHNQLSDATDTILNNRSHEIRRQKEAIGNRQEEEVEKNDIHKLSQAKQTRTVQLVEQIMVPRPPLSDFPVEALSNGLEYVDGLTEPYFTVYSSEGQRTVQNVPDAWLEEAKTTTLRSKSSRFSKKRKNGEVQEDGNVGYCHICGTAGHLILCDFCPRAFHEDCIESRDQSISTKDHWECFVCEKEKIESDDHFVDGKESLDLINAAFLNLDVTDERALVDLQILSIIHQMLKSLVDYDFGFVFSKPVDIQEVPGYTTIVKRPMDIGTICSKLINGDYTKLLDEAFSMDDLVTRVLNDIELVWRNCIRFNVIGSSVARMAFVLRRRVKMICKQSIFDKLSGKMRKDIENYEQKFDYDWTSAMVGSVFEENSNGISLDTWRENAVRNHKPRSEFKIKSAPAMGRAKRVAVLDSVTGRVVTMYTSTKAAEKAIETLLKSGHRCEWNADATRPYLNIKLILQKSRVDPSALLFGFRWLFLDDLNDRRVTFMKSVCDIIEMRYNECTFVFRSIEEALSSSRLSSTLDIDGLRKELMALGRNSNWTELNGIMWRRPILPDVRQDDSAKPTESEQPKETDFEISQSLPSWKNCAILKKDLVTDKNLVGFDSVQLAHEDWIQTAMSSPSFPENEARTVENFKKYYLDGDRNVDGMVWQSVEEKNDVEQEEEKETTARKNISDAMEIQDLEHRENNTPDSSDKQESRFPPRTDESANMSSIDGAYAAIAMTVDGQQRSVEESSISRKRKCLEDDDVDFPADKEARFAVVTVE